MDPNDPGPELKVKSKRGGARPGAGRKKGRPNGAITAKRTVPSVKKLTEAAIDPLLEAIDLYKAAKSRAARSQPQYNDEGIMVSAGNVQDYRWAMEFGLKCLAVMLPYKYPKLAPVDRLGVAVPETQVNVTVTDARQQLIALFNRELGRLRGSDGGASPGDPQRA